MVSTTVKYGKSVNMLTKKQGQINIVNIGNLMGPSKIGSKWLENIKSGNVKMGGFLLYYET